MKLILKDSTAFDIDLLSTPVDEIVKQWFKHLQHVDIPFRPWEYIGHIYNRSISSFVDDLEIYARRLSIEIDRERVFSQIYLNELHQIYECRYDGHQSWTDFHEHIHILEFKLHKHTTHRRLEMNYRQAAGLLKRPFETEWLSFGQTDLKSGDVYLAWDELGKTPYRYWYDKEPDDLQRLCQLSKPWVELRPKIHICFEDVIPSLDPDPEFQLWWQKFEKDWCHYHNISDWSYRDSKTVLVIGKINKWEDLEKKLDQETWPHRIIS